MSCSSCNCSPCTCDCCDATNEPLSSALDNFIKAFFGELTKTCVNGKVVWTLPCDLEAGCTNFPRNPGEGIACYLMRLYASGVSCSTTPPIGTCACQVLSLIPPNPYPHNGGAGMIQMALDQGCDSDVSTDSSWLHPVAPSATDLPFGRVVMGVTRIGDIVYLADGTRSFGAAPGVSTDDFWSYNMATDTWTILASTPAAATFTRLVNDGTYIYMQGGYLQGGPDDTESQVYNFRYTVATNTWDNTRAPLPATRSYQSSFRVGDYTYLFGGIAGPGIGNLSNTAWRYQISTDTWITTLATMPYATFGAGDEAWHHDGYLYMIGGYDDISTPHNRAIRYHIASDTWQSLPNIPGPFGNGGTVLIGDTIWVLGGTATPTTKNLNTYKFHIPTQTWSTVCCQLPKARGGVSASVSSDNTIFLFAGGPGGATFPIWSDVQVFPQTTFIDFTVDANSGAQRSGHIFVNCIDSGTSVQRSVEIIQS